MKKLQNWVCHRNKIPIDPKTGQNAKSNDSTTWGTYEQAKNCMERDKSITGLGFMFSNSPYVGIDIDHCVTDGRLSDFAKEIITTVQSYTEISFSGTGIHIICKGKLEGAGRKNSTLGLEMYDSGRYFTMTGKALKHYQKIGERQQEIDSICKKYFEQKKEKTVQNTVKQQVICSLEDEKLIEMAKNSQNGGKFADLYAGNWQNYYKSQSEADMALCNILAFWTGCDFDQIDRIFRTSGLMREKWNVLHGVQSYGNMTITKAIDDCDKVYEPSAVRDFAGVQNNAIDKVETPTNKIETDTKMQENAENQAENEAKDHSLDRFHKFNGKGQITGVFDAEIVDYIVENENIILVADMVHLYENGVYLPDRKGTKLKHIIQNLIYREFQTSRTVNRIYELILIQPSIKKEYWQLNQYPVSWVNFKNGMLNVETMEFYPHAPEYYSMNQIPHEYKQITKEDLVKYPHSQNFLKTSLNVKDIETVSQYMGVCLTHSTLYQIFLLLLGEGANGKSVLIDMFNAVVGENNISNLSMDKLTQRFFSSQLLFKLCNTCADISKITIDDDAELKKIIGGDMIQAEFKGKDSFSFRPYAKMLFSANRFPHVDDKSDGFKRRLRVIEMNKKPVEKDIHIKEKMLNELDFWICMAVGGLKKVLMQHDVYESENSKEARKNIYKNGDSVYSFIADCLKEEKGNELKRSNVFLEYDDYCTYYERTRVKKKTFFEELKAKGFTTSKNGQGCVIYKDVNFTQWRADEGLYSSRYN